jgi:hypothetical protein
MSRGNVPSVPEFPEFPEFRLSLSFSEFPLMFAASVGPWRSGEGTAFNLKLGMGVWLVAVRLPDRLGFLRVKGLGENGSSCNKDSKRVPVHRKLLA